MATEHTWISTGSDDFENTANWDSGEVPGTGALGADTMMFDGDSSNVSPATNLDREAAGDVQFKRIIVRKNYTGSIGASGNPLICGVDSSSVTSDAENRIIHRGTGGFYWKGRDEIKGDINDIVIDSRGGTVSLDGQQVGKSSLRHLAVKQGTVTIDGSLDTIGVIVLNGVGAIVTMAAKDSTEAEPTFIIVNNGTFTNNAAMSASKYAIIFTGTMLQTGIMADASWVFVAEPGVFEYTPASAVGSDNPNIVNFGAIDFSNSNQDLQPEGLVMGRLASVFGHIVGGIAYNPLGANLDLREEYP